MQDAEFMLTEAPDGFTFAVTDKIQQQSAQAVCAAENRANLAMRVCYGLFTMALGALLWVLLDRGPDVLSVLPVVDMERMVFDSAAAFEMSRNALSTLGQQTAGVFTGAGYQALAFVVILASVLAAVLRGEKVNT